MMTVHIVFTDGRDRLNFMVLGLSQRSPHTLYRDGVWLLNSSTGLLKVGIYIPYEDKGYGGIDFDLRLL